MISPHLYLGVKEVHEGGDGVHGGEGVGGPRKVENVLSEANFQLGEELILHSTVVYVVSHESYEAVLLYRLPYALVCYDMKENILINKSRNH